MNSAPRPRLEKKEVTALFIISLCTSLFPTCSINRCDIDELKIIHKKPFKRIKELFAQGTYIINFSDLDGILIIVIASRFRIVGRGVSQFIPHEFLQKCFSQDNFINYFY